VTCLPSAYAATKVVTANGNARISTAQSKFGEASGYFDRSGSYLSTSDSSDFAFGTASHNVVVYFNGGCPICVRYAETLEHDLNSAGLANVVKYDYYADSKALLTLSNLRENLGVPEEFYGSVTTVVDGRYVFEGYFPSDAIVSFVGSNPSFEKLIATQGLKPDTYQLLRDDVRLECGSSQKIADCLLSGMFVGVLGTWPLVLLSGLVNGLNPCALLVFVYFVGVVSVHQPGKSVLKLGAFYVLSIFIVHLALGLGLLRLFLLSGYVKVISRVYAVFLLLLASLSFKSAFRREATFPVRIPKRLISPVAETFSRSWIKTSAMGAALLFGGIAAVLEFPCASGVYAAMIALLSLQGMESMTFFLGYNFMFIVPLMILLALSYSITSAQSLKETIERHKHLSRGISALLLLGLGILLLIR
jgi:cytochrome c biogenesis protein CcdA